MSWYLVDLYTDAEDGERFKNGRYVIEAETIRAARKKVVDDHWDERLRAASCSPATVTKRISANDAEDLTNADSDDITHSEYPRRQPIKP